MLLNGNSDWIEVSARQTETLIKIEMLPRMFNLNISYFINILMPATKGTVPAGRPKLGLNFVTKYKKETILTNWSLFGHYKARRQCVLRNYWTDLAEWWRIFSEACPANFLSWKTVTTCGIYVHEVPLAFTHKYTFFSRMSIIKNICTYWKFMKFYHRV